MTLVTSRLTPIDDEYSACERTCATLSIYPNTIFPDEVSRRLELSPTATRIRGNEHTNSLGRTRIQPMNAWFLSSEKTVPSKDLRRHLDWVLNLVEPNAEQLLKLQGEPGVRMAVSCMWVSAAGQGGPSLWPEQMGRLAKLNLECALDISFFGTSEHGDPEVRFTIA